MSLVARLTLDKSQYDTGLDSASAGAKSFGSKLAGGLGTAAKVGAAALAAVGTAAVAMTTTIMNGAAEVASYGDSIDKASQKLGISAQAYQEWDAILQHSGTSMDSMSAGMKTLASKAASGSEAFQRLGISQQQAASMSREDLFAATISALQNVTDENERAQLAQELFGKSAMELGALLNTSAAETEAMRQRVHELGGVMSDEAVKAAAKYQDSLQDMQTAIDGAKRSIFAEFMPAITDVMDGLTELFSGGDGVGKISEGLTKFVDKISEIVPKVLEKGSQIVLALGKAIVENLPTLIKAAAQTLVTFIQGLVEQLPMLVEAALEVILALADGIIDALPELIPAIVEVIMKIVEILTEPETLERLVEAAVQIILALIDGIVRALPKLIAAAPKIISNLVSALVRGIPQIIGAGAQIIGGLIKGIASAVGSLFEVIGGIGRSIWEGFSNLISSAWTWGKDLILSFWEGIKAFVSKPIEAIKGLAAKIRGFIGFSEPEDPASPLHNFHTYAPDMMQLFAQGIKDNKKLVTDAISETFALPSVASAANAGQEIAVPRSTGAQSVQAATMEIDRAVFARLVFKLYNEEAARVGVKLAGVSV